MLASLGPLKPVTMETPEGSRNDSLDSLVETLKWKQHRSTKANSLQPLKKEPLTSD